MFRALLVLLTLTCVAAAGTYLWYRSAVYSAVEHGVAGQIVRVEPGTSSSGVIGQLATAGIIRHPAAAKLYLRITGRGSQLKAGDYSFDSPISPAAALDKIRRGEVFLERVTIPEGLNRFEIAEILAVKTRKASKEEFLKLVADQSSILRLAPEARDLEGYLFPDTYSYSSATTAEELIEAMVNRFSETFGPQWVTRASELGMTVHQVVTLASIIEEEARVADERPLISSVFANRLRLGMPLGSDPTFIYAAVLVDDYDGNPNQPRHRQRDSRYNTYLYAGLPPGPIASPGRASLEAALYPADSQYLFFVVNGFEGRHKFSRTSAEHEAAVAEYRRQVREGK